MGDWRRSVLQKIIDNAGAGQHNQQPRNNVCRIHVRHSACVSPSVAPASIIALTDDKELLRKLLIRGLAQPAFSPQLIHVITPP
jgi:hypothetical protein